MTIWIMAIRETDVYKKWFARLKDTVAKTTGLWRESLYKTLSPDGNPALATILKILKAFDFNLRAACL